MIEICREMTNLIQKAYAGNLFLPLYLLCLLYLFFCDREKRRILVYPSVILLLFIFNPVLYKVVYLKTLKYAYWRLLWTIPVVPVLAYTAIHIVDTMPKRWMKALVCVELAIVLIGGGSWLYQGVPREFRHATNAHKIPQEAVDVCNALLALEEEPRVVMDANLFCYTRQFSSGIHQMYGRDVLGFIAKPQEGAKPIYEEMIKQEPDFEVVYQGMTDLDYQYLVMKPSQKPKQGEMGEYGFTFLTEVDGYEIYQIGA